MGATAVRAAVSCWRPRSESTACLTFRYRNLFRAEAGRNGAGRNRQGRSGEDLVMEVPVGTVAKDPLTGEILADLTEPCPEVDSGQRGKGREGKRPFRQFDFPVPPFRAGRRTGGATRPETRAEAHCRRRLGGASKRREIDPRFSGLSGAAQDSRLPVYHPYAKSRGRAVRRRSTVCHGGCAGAYRGSARGRGPGSPVSQTHREDPAAGSCDRPFPALFRQPPGAVQADRTRT